ncbi:DNA/RNA polymerase [Phellopilus nigrolimitatus]|nr:DNA/RNA polymerase [Phellopilus nigrolimitatus]
MIPLTRRSSSRKLETTLLSCSRQNLPRPARLYSSPSKRNQAPALATATAPPVNDIPSYMTSAQRTGSAASSVHMDGIHSFLRRRMPYTLLPPPLPDDTSSALNDFYFPDSPIQDSLAVIDACLHGCYDVPRAKFVFSQLREKRQGEAIVQPRLYNLFLESYLEMALEKDAQNGSTWLEDAWALYEAMENGEDKVAPAASTYAIMLKIWLKSNSMELPVTVSSERSPSDLLRCMINRHIPVTTVVADRVLTSGDAGEIVQHLSRAAAELGLIHVITELGQAESIAADPLKDVPDIVPVRRAKLGSIPFATDLPDLSMEELAAEASELEQEMPFNISNLRKHLAEVAYAQRVLPDDAAARQKLLEASVYDLAVHRLRHEAEKLDELGLNTQSLLQPHLQKWMFEWHGKLQKRLAAEIALIIEEEASLPLNNLDNHTRMRLGPFLSLLKPEKLSLISILELMRLQGTGGVNEGMKTARALLTVGKAVEMEYKAEILKKNNIHVPQTPARPNDSGYFTKRAFKELQEWRQNAANYMEETQDWTSDWTHAVRARVGSFLVDSLMDVAIVTRNAVDKRTGEQVSEDQPAFYHSYEYLRGHKLGVIRLNPVVADRLAKDDIKATLHPRHLPMLIKPKPWVSHDEGGYVFNKTSVMRLKDTQEQLTYLRHASAAGHMEHVFAGLDVLGSTPWKINREIFDVVLQVWNSGERFGKIPPSTFDKQEPVKPANYETDVLAKSTYLREMREWQLEKANNHSNRCSVNYKVEIARAFLADTMYLPHNIDFRGRAYPIPPHLNHIGDDLSRGLMKFAEAKPLGASGLRWLKIHLANLYGYDKGSFDERVQFVHDHISDIYDSAEKPTDGQGWWKNADDAWQCLAACKELRAALESGDPEAFVSNLPVHQDGTCNGLQHYAALGGDMKGAKQVNLDVTDRPADVYTHVADMVESLIKADVEKGDKYAQMLQGKVSRKVVKQTVMTTVYGVTYVGARSQIEKQLRERGDIAPSEAWSAAAYLTKNVIFCIGDLFSGAKKIQSWLTLSARLISKSMPRERVEEAIEAFTKKKPTDAPGSAPSRRVLPVSRLPKEMMTSVVWTTPLGLPIVQPYRKTKRRQIMTSIQTVFISDPNSPSEVNPTKQSSAFPPNFIHSLDATHMMLTALECSRRGITFASVHDSYWTHAGSIDEMNTIIRDTFIALHESDVLTRLHQEFIDRYKDYQVPVMALRSKTMLDRLKIQLNALSALAVLGDANIPSEQIGLEGEDLELALDAEDAEVDEVETADEPETPQKLGRPKKGEQRNPKPKSKPKEREVVLRGEGGGVMSRFVNLVDLLPPLPKKGEFDVKRIRDSKYFFS